MNRSPTTLAEIATKLDPANNPLWKRRDITGDGVPETFCNQFLHDALELLDVPLPKGMLARQQIAWLSSDVGKAHGWRPVERGEAFHAANRGEPVVVGWCNPDASRSSHVALVMPTPFGFELQIAQAGRVNFNSDTLTRGFGAATPDVCFWWHR